MGFGTPELTAQGPAMVSHASLDFGRRETRISYGLAATPQVPALGRAWQIIYDINFYFLEDMKKRIGNDYSRLARMSIIEEGASKV